MECLLKKINKDETTDNTLKMCVVIQNNKYIDV